MERLGSDGLQNRVSLLVFGALGAGFLGEFSQDCAVGVALTVVSAQVRAVVFSFELGAAAEVLHDLEHVLRGLVRQLLVGLDATRPYLLPEASDLRHQRLPRHHRAESSSESRRSRLDGRRHDRLKLVWAICVRAFRQIIDLYIFHNGYEMLRLVGRRHRIQMHRHVRVARLVRGRGLIVAVVVRRGGLSVASSWCPGASRHAVLELEG